MKKKKILKAHIYKENGHGYDIDKVVELPSLQGVDALISAWLLLDCCVEFFIDEIEESEDENK